MNQVIRSILKRRSVRQYDKEQITEEQLQVLLQTAAMAPNAYDRQERVTVAVQNRALLDEISKDVQTMLLSDPLYREEASVPDFHVFFHAPTVFVVCGPAYSKYAIQDCAVAAENIQIAAHAMGLGSCYIGLADPYVDGEKGRQMVKRLGVSGDYRIMCCVTVGLPKEQPNPTPRKEGVTFVVR
ncbi:nitroreductase family protein [Solibaculum mannosilyticum]|uniref:Nitroreductase n=1 Tax=Solibaculum mannosilyticum TaxID=2780922 RepID=A0A7I8D2U2_9FIRM|nr:nitroreductase family protein [Solibaculum mannosilyticum]BCI61138.1 nitroreductase [Solibaculum mannosilyticum]